MDLTDKALWPAALCAALVFAGPGDAAPVAFQPGGPALESGSETAPPPAVFVALLPASPPSLAGGPRIPPPAPGTDIIAPPPPVPPSILRAYRGTQGGMGGGTSVVGLAGFFGVQSVLGLWVAALRPGRPLRFAPAHGRRALAYVSSRASSPSRV